MFIKHFKPYKFPLLRQTIIYKNTLRNCIVLFHLQLIESFLLFFFNKLLNDVFHRFL